VVPAETPPVMLVMPVVLVVLVVLVVPVVLVMPAPVVGVKPSLLPSVSAPDVAAPCVPVAPSVLWVALKPDPESLSAQPANNKTYSALRGTLPMIRRICEQ